MRRQLWKRQPFFSVTILFVVTLLVYGQATAQDRLADSTPKKRLVSPTAKRGLIGGESHDSYVIRGHKGETLSISISWREERDNNAEFSVSESPNFFDAEDVPFGRASNDGRRWSGRIPKTRDYYIYVVAHPEAHYTLRVRLR
ncbi:MAG TPA: hypothetical protein VJX67_05235 [Blastocatellia bacterium]|nr:hypothetical protein [Blastocatellia bacterium]